MSDNCGIGVGERESVWVYSGENNGFLCVWEGQRCSVCDCVREKEQRKKKPRYLIY